MSLAAKTGFFPIARLKPERAQLYILIETAKANGLNPNIYIEALFERFPKAESDDQIKDLLPCYTNFDRKKSWGQTSWWRCAYKQSILKNTMKTILKLLVLPLFAGIIFSHSAQAGEKLLMEGKHSLYKEGDQLIGGGYTTGSALSGLDFRYTYFAYDDLSIQVDYSPLSYDYGWGKANANLFSAAAILHFDWWRFNVMKERNNGFYAGLGYAIGKATYKSSNYWYSYETEVDLGGLYWTSGWELKLKNNVKLQVGYNYVGLNIGADYQF